MHRILTQFFRIFGRVLALLSLVALLFVGGTFSHASELPHQHIDLHTGNKVHETAHHSHISNPDQDSNKASGMHCGADIHCLIGSAAIIFEKKILNEFYPYGRQTSKVMFWPEPPPPRSIS